MYIDTFTIGACDSIRTLNLSYFEPTVFDTTICESDFVPGTFPGMTIDENGCEQVQNLTLIPNSVNTTNVTLCQGSVLDDGNGGIYDEAGMYTIETISNAGCDSLIILNLSYYPVSPEIIMTACSSDFPEPTAPGTYTSTTIDANGCDQLNILTVLSSTPDVVTDVEICPGDTVIWMDLIITEIGSYQEFQINANGCEYTEILRVFEKPTTECLVSTEAKRLSPHIKLYPNPAHTYLLVQGLESGQKSHRVELISSTGQAISATTTLDTEVRLDISTLPAGLYTAKISAEGVRGIKVITFVKE